MENTNNLTDENTKLKKKSIGVAKRIMFLSELCIISIVNCAVSLIIFLLLEFGTSIVGNFINGDFSKESFMYRGGIFIYSSVIFVNLFAITGIWYALGFLRLQLQCKKLRIELDGAKEVNRIAYEESLSGSKTASAAAGPISVAYIYLKQNDQLIPKHKIFVIINISFVLAQIVLAIISIVIWVNFP